MSIHEKTADLLSLLGSVSENERSTAIELTVETFKATDEYKIIQSLDRYMIVSDRGQRLVDELQTIDFENASTSELKQLYNRMKKLTNEFLRLVQSSHQLIDQGRYDVDIVSIDKLERSSKRLKRIIRVLDRSDVKEPAYAFREYLKSNNDSIIQEEYVRIRPEDLQRSDEQYSEYRFSLFFSNICRYRFTN